MFLFFFFVVCILVIKFCNVVERFVVGCDDNILEFILLNEFVVCFFDKVWYLVIIIFVKVVVLFLSWILIIFLFICVFIILLVIFIKVNEIKFLDWIFNVYCLFILVIVFLLVLLIIIVVLIIFFLFLFVMIFFIKKDWWFIFLLVFFGKIRIKFFFIL